MMRPPLQPLRFPARVQCTTYICFCTLHNIDGIVAAPVMPVIFHALTTLGPPSNIPGTPSWAPPASALTKAEAGWLSKRANMTFTPYLFGLGRRRSSKCDFDTHACVCVSCRVAVSPRNLCSSVSARRPARLAFILLLLPLNILCCRNIKQPTCNIYIIVAEDEANACDRK